MSDPIDLLWQAAQIGQLDPTPLNGRFNVEQGERLQLQMLDRWCAQGESLAGWKVGLTSGRSRDAFGPGIRPFGYILKSRVLNSGATIDLQKIPNLGLETELCWRLGERLAGRSISPAQVKRAIAAVMPAFEVNQLRTPNQADPGVRTADNLSQWGLVIGPEIAPVPNDFSFDALVVEQHRNGACIERVAAAGHMDDHYVSLARLVHELSRFGLALEPNQWVITGSFTRQVIDGAGVFTGDFSELGQVQVQFV